MICEGNYESEMPMTRAGKWKAMFFVALMAVLAYWALIAALHLSVWHLFGGMCVWAGLGLGCIIWPPPRRDAKQRK